jgi:hypothetical protein
LVSFVISAFHAPSSLNISCLVCAYSFEPPPSITYDASVNGAPAKPISGTSAFSSRRTKRIVSITKPSDSRASIVSRTASTAFAERIGSLIFGPSSLVNSKPMPSGLSTSRMSANKIAASTPSCSTGSSVTCAATSERSHISMKLSFSRSARYSG